MLFMAPIHAIWSLAFSSSAMSLSSLYLNIYFDDCTDKKEENPFYGVFLIFLPRNVRIPIYCSNEHDANFGVFLFQ